MTRLQILVSLEGMLNWLIELDHQLFEIINHIWTHPVLDQVMPAITDLHKTGPFKIIAPLLFFILFKRSYTYKKAIAIFLGLLICLGVADFTGNQFFKQTIQRARPGDNSNVSSIVRSPYGGYSFTSNHSTNMFALATYSSAFVPASGFVLFPVAGLIGYSRVYNGVHFPLDVLCGGLWGIINALVFSRLIRRWTHRKPGQKKDRT